MTAWLASWGIINPHLSSDFGDALDKSAQRLPRLDRMALAAARQALRNQSTEDTGLIFATGYGELGATASFLDGVWQRGAAFGSPSAFFQSVHHAPAGQLSIALGLRGLCLTESSREVSGEAALAVAYRLLASGRASQMLVVAADEVTPALVRAFKAFPTPLVPGEGAAALLLSRTPASSFRLRLEAPLVQSHPVSGLAFPNSRRQLEPLLQKARLSLPTLVSPAACGADFDGPEREILEALAPTATRLETQPDLRLNPSGGLLRVVSCAQRMLDTPSLQSALIHGVSLGGQQYVTVLNRG